LNVNLGSAFLENSYKYKAFVSYSRRDEKAARWLQRAIEGYRLPKNLKAALLKQGKSTILSPVFRDREDLHASSSLGDVLMDALSQSEYLIVVCSPNTVASEWVNQEISEFIKLRSVDNVLAVILDGEPNALLGGRPAEEECFPELLRFELEADGSLSDRRREPLAPDLRTGGDGRRLVRLKLIASMLHVDLDQLVQREAQRRVQLLGALATFALVLAGVLSLMTIQTLRANKLAEVQRVIAEERRESAEGLIEFMLGDLRDQLEPVGRLAVLDSVGARALTYYDELGQAQMDADSIGRRSRAMLLLGEIQRGKGNLSQAADMFSRVAEDTALLLAEDPGNTKRIYDHAQSTFWQGYIAWEILDFVKASRHLSEYLALAQQLTDIEPDNIEWQLELHYGFSNIGSLFYQQGEWAIAQANYSESLRIIAAILEAYPDNPEYLRNYAEEASWLASAYLASNQYKQSAKFNTREYEIYEKLLLVTPEDRTVASRMVNALITRATLQLIQGQTEQALNTLVEGNRLAASLTQLDPENADYWKSYIRTSANLARFHLSTGSLQEALTHLKKCQESGFRLDSMGAESGGWLLTAYSPCQLAAVRYWLIEGDIEQARVQLKELQEVHAALPGKLLSHRTYPEVTAEISLYLGDIVDMDGDASLANSYWRNALDTLPLLTNAQFHIKFDALVRLDEVTDARVVGLQLVDNGYLHHEFIQSYHELSR
jgi:tetratricopeptide (TPR) repeat protein